MHDLCVTFALVYRHRWVLETDEAEHAVKHLWAKTLSGIDEKIIRETMYECITNYPSWPPTPGEFLAIAIPKKRAVEEKRQDETRVRERSSLLQQTGDPNTAKLALFRIKEGLKKRNETQNKDS